MDATSIPITATLTSGTDGLDLAATVDLPSLDLKLEGGLWKGKAEVVARFMSADAKQVGEVVAQTLVFNLRPPTYESLLRTGVSYRKKLKIPAKAVELKVLVGNLESGKIGTLTIPLSK
jgi:hypothetical protein